MYTRKQFVVIVPAVLMMAFVSIGARKAGIPQKLTVTGGEPVIYKCDKGVRLTVQYFSLSDKSLDFVKVTLPGGKVHTLPRAMSASGERFTNDRELVWWIKGETGFVEERGRKGDYETKYQNCKEMKMKRQVN